MSRKEVLNSPFALINMMLADSPKLKKKGEKKLTTDQEMAAFFGAEIEQ